MEFVDLTQLFKEYANKWVAMTDDDKIICAGRTLDDVMKKAKLKGYEEPVTMKVPSHKVEFVLDVHAI